jgi:quercetin 2,3-dioxygenase
VQWMTAGSGIVHQEMPQRYDGRMRGYQLWVNLPAAHKMMEPRYRDVGAASICEVEAAEGVRVKVIAGEVAGARGPVRDVIADPAFLDLALAPAARFEHAVPPNHTVLAYVVTGSCALGNDAGRELAEGQLAVLVEGDAVRVAAGPAGARILLFSAKPLREPVAWHGPIVMNTQDELETAFRELDEGTFVKHGT